MALKAAENGSAEKNSFAQRAFDVALFDLAAAISARDKVLMRLHSAHFAQDELTKERDALLQAVAQFKEQNEQLLQRAQSAERIALEQTNAMLEVTKQEIRQLSEAIDTVQNSRVWKVKRFLGKLRSLLIR